ncbi:hypothetical protein CAUPRSCDRAFT_12682 [Caulochytrium protostelioides]|nr:hypothetical protein CAUPRSCDRAFT_12682 [Caulochytrium protostelioides]
MSPAAASQSDAQDLAMLPHHRRPLMSRTTSMSRKLPDLLRDEQAYRSDNYTFRLERLMQRLDDADDEHVDDGEAGVEGEGDADDDDGLAEGSAARGSGAQDASDLDPLYGDEYTRLTSGARRPLAALVDDDEEEEEEEEDNIDHAAYA